MVESWSTTQLFQRVEGRVMHSGVGTLSSLLTFPSSFRRIPLAHQDQAQDEVRLVVAGVELNANGELLFCLIKIAMVCEQISQAAVSIRQVWVKSNGYPVLFPCTGVGRQRGVPERSHPRGISATCDLW